MSNFKNNNQWSTEELIKGKDDRCWEGYEPAKGKKAYEKGSCVKKGDDKQLSVKDAVDMIMTDKYEVQDVIDRVPEDKRDDVLAKLRELKQDKDYPHKSVHGYDKETKKADHGKVAPEGSRNRKTYLKEFEKKDCEEQIKLNKGGQWFLEKTSRAHQHLMATDEKYQPSTEKNEGMVNCAPGDANSAMGKKEDCEDKMEDVAEKEIKEHEKEKHSVEGHKKEHKKMKEEGKMDKEEDMKKNPMATAAIGAAATGFGTQMADRAADKVGM